MIYSYKFLNTGQYVRMFHNARAYYYYWNTKTLIMMYVIIDFFEWI